MINRKTHRKWEINKGNNHKPWARRQKKHTMDPETKEKVHKDKKNKATRESIILDAKNNKHQVYAVTGQE